MAISGGDGSIILTTKVDTSGIKQGTKEALKFAELSINEQRRLAQSLSGVYRKQGLSQSEAQKKAWDDLKANTVEAKNLTAAMKGAEIQTKAFGSTSQSSGRKATTAISKISTSLKNLLTYFIGIQTVFAAIRFSGEASEFATQTEASVQRLVDIYGEAAQSVGDFIDANARAIGMSKASASSFASVYGNLFSVWADQATNAELTNQYLNMTAVVASKTGRTIQDVQERVRSGLLGNTEAIEDLGVFVNVKTIEMTDAFKRMADGRSWEQLDAYTQQQVRSMAILEQATAKYGTTVADTTATTRAQYQAAYEDFQNTWGQVVNVVLIPVLKVATQVLSVLTRGLQIIAGISGKTIESNSAFESQASSIGGAVENQEALTKAVEDTAKAQKKSLAGFDQINKLTESTAGASGGAGTSGGGAVGGGAVGGGGGESYNNSFVDKIDADLAAIMGFVGFALVAIGVLLICFGHIGWGIGFIIAGATIFSVSQAALSEGAEAEKVKNIMNGIIAGISLLALVLGIIIVCTTKDPKNLALGIGLIVVGAAGLATEIALNWNAIKEKVQKFFTENGALIAGISLALVVLGILVCFTPLLGLGIGLIVVGVAGLAATVALNWNSVKEKVTSAFNSVIKWVKTWGLLVLGIILVISGVAVPLGLALIKKGADNLVSVKDPTWMAFLDKIKEVCEKIKAYWRSNMAKYFTKEYWAKKGKDMVNGLIKKVVNGLNNLISKINNFGFNLPDVLGGGKVGFNIPKLNIPQLAKGAVIPPNKSFLAVLGDQKSGTNIEAPLSTIEEAVQNVLSRNGNLGGGVIENVIMLDGEVLYRSQKNIERRKGVSFATGGSW